MERFGARSSLGGGILGLAVRVAIDIVPGPTGLGPHQQAEAGDTPVIRRPATRSGLQVLPEGAGLGAADHAQAHGRHASVAPADAVEGSSILAVPAGHEEGAQFVAHHQEPAVVLDQLLGEGFHGSAGHGAAAQERCFIGTGSQEAGYIPQGGRSDPSAALWLLQVSAF